MPWDKDDAKGKTKKANTPAKKRKWAKIANAVLKDSGDEALAIRVANSKIKGPQSK